MHYNESASCSSRQVDHPLQTLDRGRDIAVAGEPPQDTSRAPCSGCLPFNHSEAGTLEDKYQFTALGWSGKNKSIPYNHRGISITRTEVRTKKN